VSKEVTMQIRYPVLFLSLLVLMPGAGAGAAADLPAYSVADLRTLGVWPVTMNAKGEVVGRACCGRDSPNPIVYSSSSVRELALPSNEFGPAYPTDINDAGQVVGYVALPRPEGGQYRRAFFVDDSRSEFIDTSGIEGGRCNGYPDDTPVAVNNAGMVVGNYYDEICAGAPWLYSGGIVRRISPADVKLCRAEAINASGEVVGYCYLYKIFAYRAGTWRYVFEGGEHAFNNDVGAIAVVGRSGAGVPSQGTLIADGVTYGIPPILDVPQVPGVPTSTIPAGMNEHNEVVGTSNGRAFLYRAGETTGLGALPGGGSSAASSINDFGYVVGAAEDAMGATRPFVAHGGALFDLADLRGVGAALQMRQTTHVRTQVNDAAQILVIGSRATTDGTALEAAYLLTPVVPVVTLTAVPSSVAVRTSVTLTWRSQNANSCVATGGVAGDGWAGTQPASGQVTVTSGVPGAVQYAIRCSAGPLASDSAVLVTYAAAPPTVRLTATPSVSRVRAAITLAWTTEGADNCMATGGRPGDGWVGALATSGNRQVTEMSPGVVEYGVKCSAGELSSEAKASVTFEKKSGGGGHVDVIALLGLAGLGLSRRRRH
jgi:hypothetical protein